jgi:hypothetical protein
LQREPETFSRSQETRNFTHTFSGDRFYRQAIRSEVARKFYGKFSRRHAVIHGIDLQRERSAPAIAAKGDRGPPSALGVLRIARRVLPD